GDDAPRAEVAGERLLPGNPEVWAANQHAFADAREPRDLQRNASARLDQAVDQRLAAQGHRSDLDDFSRRAKSSRLGVENHPALIGGEDALRPATHARAPRLRLR